MVHIHCENITIGKVSHSSAILSGENYPVRWRHKQETNSGFGEYAGDYLISFGNHHSIQLVKPNKQKGSSTCNGKRGKNTPD